MKHEGDNNKKKKCGDVNAASWVSWRTVEVSIIYCHGLSPPVLI